MTPGDRGTPRGTGAEERERAALLARVGTLMEPYMQAHVEEFYDTLRGRSGPETALSWLSASDFDRLKAGQSEHLRTVLDPSVDRSALRERSRQLGRVHAASSIEMEWYVEAVSSHLNQILDRLADEEGLDQSAAHSVLSSRFMDDLHGGVLGYRDVDAAQMRAMMRATRAVSAARTVPDLARGVLEAITELDGVVAGLFARAGEDGRLQFEIGTGPVAEGFIDDLSSGTPSARRPLLDDPGAVGPTSRAWRTGEVQRSDSYLTDLSTAPWWDLAEQHGYRSSTAIPLADPKGRPRAVVSLYADVPGFFAADGRMAMLEQIRHMMEAALIEIEAGSAAAAAVSGYDARTGHIARLRAGEVLMLFQPVVELSTGRTLKLEALGRLRDGDRLVPPSEFLPAFGDDELLLLFEAGLHQALAAARSWERSGVVADVSVNLPVSAAQEERYALAVRAALEEHGVDAGRLTLELLETGHLDMAERRQAFSALKRLGVRLAQDDLGSGYSSLLRLRHFTFDEVKVDQRLVGGTAVAPRAALHFVQPITDIAHSLGLTVVLEGLEDEGLIEAAVQLDVDAGQGFGIARPMPADKVPDWVRAYRLDLDPARPRTPLGALAAHVAWEHRVTALDRSPVRSALLDQDVCVLSGYIAERLGDEVARAHATVHRAALAGRGGPAHRAAWERLVMLMDEG
jgi:EAL domain-containing protein (putative c-di-GMP-specific phosphodiesterase class I)